MFLGLFRRKAKVVKVKRKTKKTQSVRKPKKPKLKRVKKVSRPVKAAPRKKAPEMVGKVTHYFPHVKAGVILVTKGNIAVGDTLLIKGHTTDFKQKVTSMQINNAPIKEAKPKDEIGLLVKSRVRHNDIVYKL